ncbi:unnamed protein product [Caenorhabditis angaria]|uniref:Uncharacterized protein n=1 Tax=Caenorhabditis angaria TaxID=860376 RepID=A0A9P1MTD3_9PELO|nr:unnamed protein product [Caenorhabditis angaria]
MEVVENYLSDSSVLAEANSSDSKEQLIDKENEKASSEVKERRINRRIALAMARAQDSSPQTLSKLQKTSADKTIDLTNEDDDPTHKWFKKTFKVDEKAKKVEKKQTDEFQKPHNFPAHAPRSLSTSAMIKKKLAAGLAVKRMKGLEQRRQMYEMDNQHLKPDSDEDEEYEEKTLKRKKKVVKPGDYDSEDDSDYDPTKGSGEDGEADDESHQQVNHIRYPADDEVSVNLLNDSFTYDVFKNVGHQHGPGSTISTLDGHIEKNGVLKLPNVEEMEAQIEKPSTIEDDFGDILSLCSGKFGATQFGTQVQTSSSIKHVEEEKPIPQVESFSPKHNNEEEEEEEVIVPKSQKKQKRNMIDSDDEENNENDEDKEMATENNIEDSLEGNSDEVVVEKTEISITTTTRIVVRDESSDSENEEDEEENIEEEFEEPEEEEKEEEEEDEEAPNFDDEDDELAVLKRIEYQEYKTKSKKKNFFDDEASLSGDDVGSENEDEDPENDYYEAEEGDADDLPDNDTIRKQNHRLMMKQENDKEQRALLKLQDRLLADGDLGGIETNRQFRFRLREETEAKIEGEMNILVDGENVEQDEEEEKEEDETKKAERAQMLKFRIEKAEELMMLDEPVGMNDPFARAAKLVKSTKINIEVVEGTEIIKPVKRIEKPSLLKKTTLATTMQEVLIQTTSAAPKQMYVHKYESAENRNQKRQLQQTTPETSTAKRLKPSKLSILE